MPGGAYHRNVTPLLDFFRTLLRGRALEKPALRFADEQAARTQPPPDLPPGPNDKLTGIYYFARDARREVPPPIVIIPGELKLESKKDGVQKSITPGNVYQQT